MVGRRIRIILIAWIAMVGIDFFLHGGLLARLYTRESAFLLPPAEAFRLIPLGYLSFLVLAVLLVWLVERLDISGWRPGFIFGLKLGALTWGALVLGLLSISTADGDLLLGWFAGQTLELGAAGAFAGAAFAGGSLRGLFFRALLLVVVMIVLTVIMQNTGLAPAATL